MLKLNTNEKVIIFKFLHRMLEAHDKLLIKLQNLVKGSSKDQIFTHSYGQPT